MRNRWRRAAALVLLIFVGSFVLYSLTGAPPALSQGSESGGGGTGGATFRVNGGGSMPSVNMESTANSGTSTGVTQTQDGADVNATIPDLNLTGQTAKELSDVADALTPSKCLETNASGVIQSSADTCGGAGSGTDLSVNGGAVMTTGNIRTTANAGTATGITQTQTGSNIDATIPDLNLTGQNAKELADVADSLTNGQCLRTNASTGVIESSGAACGGTGTDLSVNGGATMSTANLRTTANSGTVTGITISVPSGSNVDATIPDLNLTGQNVTELAGVADTLTASRCLETDASGNVQSSGAACGTSTGAPLGASYLVGSADGSLSNEIVAGATPGGELAGAGSTWASPIISDSVTVSGWTLSGLTTVANLGRFSWGSGSYFAPPSVTAAPSAPATNDVVIRTNAATAGSCNFGTSGSAFALCRYNGSTWDAIGDGGSGGAITSIAGDTSSATGSTVTLAGGKGIATTGNAASTVTLDYKYTYPLTTPDAVLAPSECVFSSSVASDGGILCEGTAGGGASGSEHLFLFPAHIDNTDTTDYIVTATNLPTAAGMINLSTNTSFAGNTWVDFGGAGDVDITSAGVTSIVAEKITESMFKTGALPTNGFCLTAQSGAAAGGGLAWASCGTGGTLGNATFTTLSRDTGTLPDDADAVIKLDVGKKLCGGDTDEACFWGDATGNALYTANTHGFSGNVGVNGSVNSTGSAPRFIWDDTDTAGNEEVRFEGRGMALNNSGWQISNLSGAATRVGMLSLNTTGDASTLYLGGAPAEGTFVPTNAITVNEAGNLSTLGAANVIGLKNDGTRVFWDTNADGDYDNLEPNLTVNAPTNAVGDQSINGNLAVGGTTTLAGNLTATGTGTQAFSGAISAPSITTTGNATIGGTLGATDVNVNGSVVAYLLGSQQSAPEFYFNDLDNASAKEVSFQSNTPSAGSNANWMISNESGTSGTLLGMIGVGTDVGASTLYFGSLPGTLLSTGGIGSSAVVRVSEGSVMDAINGARIKGTELDSGGASVFWDLKFEPTVHKWYVDLDSGSTVSPDLDAGEEIILASTGTFTAAVTAPSFSATTATTEPGNRIQVAANETPFAASDSTCANSGTSGFFTILDADEASGSRDWRFCDGTSNYQRVVNTGSNTIGSGQIMVGTGTNIATYQNLAGSVVALQSGTAALGTSTIASGACASAVTVSATGVATTDVIAWTPNADITAVTGYAPVTGGALIIYPYPTANNVNFKVCNPTGAPITPGAVTLNWRVAR